MTNAHKIVLSLIATICLTLIVFYSVKGNSQHPASAPPSMAVIERTPKQISGATPASPATSVIVGPTANNNATGLDDLVARVRNEVAAGEPAVNQAGTADNHASEDLSASSNATASASPTNGPADSPAANNHSGFDFNPRGDAPIDSSFNPSVDSSTPPYTGSVEPDRFAANAPAVVELDESEVPSFTLGQPLEETLIPGDSPSDLETSDLPKLPDIDETVTPLTGSEAFDGAAGHTDDPAVHSAERTKDADNSDNTALSRDPFGAPRLFGVDTTPAQTDRTAANSQARAPQETRPTGPWQPPRDVERRDDQDNTTLTTSATPRTYTIKAGDSFSSIATAIFGAEKHWIDIADANPKVDPKRIKIGQVINLPDLQKDDQPPVTSPPSTPAPPARDHEATPAQPAPAPRIHEVKAGENLSSISRRYYNTPDHWRHLYLTNRDLIGSDPGKLQAGTKLKITTPPKD